MRACGVCTCGKASWHCPCTIPCAYPRQAVHACLALQPLPTLPPPPNPPPNSPLPPAHPDRSQHGPVPLLGVAGARPRHRPVRRRGRAHGHGPHARVLERAAGPGPGHQQPYRAAQRLLAAGRCEHTRVPRVVAGHAWAPAAEPCSPPCTSRPGHQYKGTPVRHANC